LRRHDAKEDRPEKSSLLPVSGRPFVFIRKYHHQTSTAEQQVQDRRARGDGCWPRPRVGGDFLLEEAAAVRIATASWSKRRQPLVDPSGGRRSAGVISPA